MKTGLESLDTGAPEITYSGNQGPKSPQEDQQKMAEFELQEYMEEFERVFPDMKDQRGTPDYMKELQDYFEGLASKQDEGIGNMAMKPGLIDEYRNYKMGQEEAGEQFMSPRDYYRSQEQDRMGAAGGGIMGSNAGSMLVAPTKDGTRPGYAFAGTGGRTSSGDVGAANNPERRNYEIANTRSYTSPTTQAPTPILDDRQIGNIDKRTVKINDRYRQNVRGEDYKLAKVPIEYEKYKNKKSLVPSYIKAIGPMAYLPGDKAKAIARRREYAFEKGFGDWFDTLSDDEVISTDMMNFLSYSDSVPKDGTDETYADYAFDRGLPGLKMSGNVGGLGNKYVKSTGKYEPTIYGYEPSGRGQGAQILPYPTTTSMAVGEDVDIADTDTTDFVSRFAPVTSLPFADYRGGIEVPAADGGRIGYADGGITDLRQGYFLGKLVKKATRAVKKIAKSPIGKAALLAGGAGLLGGIGPFAGLRTSSFGKLLMGGKLAPGMMGPTRPGLFGKALGYAKANPFTTIGLTSLLPFLMPEEEDNLDDATGQAARGPSIQDVFGMDLNQIAKGAREGNLDPNIFNFLQTAADGGRIGLAAGGIGDLRGALSKEMFNLGEEDDDEIKKLAFGGSAGMPPVTMMSEGANSMSFPDDESTGMAQATPTATLPNQMPRPKPMMDPRMMQQMMMAQKGMMQQPRIMAQEGGMMDMGGMEKDYRNDGGFVPIGGQERADDVPARLSKNEFVFTADAVRNAGGGDIDKGAEIMENMMENLEAGGKVSQGSQGLSGAREMFQTQQRLGEVL